MCVLCTFVFVYMCIALMTTFGLVRFAVDQSVSMFIVCQPFTMQNLFAEAYWLMECSLGDSTLNIDGTQAHTDIGGAVGSIVEPFEYFATASFAGQRPPI